MDREIPELVATRGLRNVKALAQTDLADVRIQREGLPDVIQLGEAEASSMDAPRSIQELPTDLGTALGQ